MAVLKKQFEVGSKTIWVRQASGMERSRFETMLAKTFRKFKHFGFDQSTWTDEQQEEFMVALEEMGGGMESQICPCPPLSWRRVQHGLAGQGRTHGDF